MAVPRPIDEQFSDDYGQRTSAPPSTGRIQNFRRVKVDERRSTTSSPAVTTRRKKSETGNPTEDGPGKSSVSRVERTYTRRSVVTPSIARTKNVTRATSAVSGTVGKRVNKVKRKFQRQAFARVTTIPATLLFWGWIVQLALAAFNFIFLSIALLISDSIGQDTNEEGNVTGWVIRGVAQTFNTLNEALNYLGIDLSGYVEIFSPTTWFLVTYFLVLIIGFTSLFVLGLLYTVTGFKSLHGKGATAKQAGLLLSMICYMVPVLNLLPAFLIWVFTIWRNPR